MFIAGKRNQQIVFSHEPGFALTEFAFMLQSRIHNTVDDTTEGDIRSEIKPFYVRMR